MKRSSNKKLLLLLARDSGVKYYFDAERGIVRRREGEKTKNA